MKYRFLVLGLFVFAVSQIGAEEQEQMRMLSSSATYPEQLAAVNGGRYGVSELMALLQNEELVSGLFPNQERSVLNEVMNRLRQMEPPDSGLEDALMRVASDSTRDPGVREYAVQHLFLWYANASRKSKVEDYLWRCTEDPVVSSTAILQLHHFGTKSGATLSKPLAPVVLKAMARSDLRNADRSTLLLVAAERGITNALPFAREWAVGVTDRVVLQAALTAIGKLGSVQDLGFLDQLGKQHNLDEVRKTLEYTQSQLSRKKSME